MKKTIFLFLILYITSLSATAAIDDKGDRWFEVEILVFSRQDDTTVEDNEIWPEMAAPAELAQSIFLAPVFSPIDRIDDQAGSMRSLPGESSIPERALEGSGNSVIIPYQILTDSDLKLTSFENKLSRSSQIDPIYHIAWRQPAFLRGDSTPVRIQWEKQVHDDADSLTSEESLITPPQMPVVADNDSGDDVPDRVQSLEGSITVSANRYLHVDVDLFYRQDEPVEKDQNIFNIFDVFRIEDTPRVFRMNQTRRMRSGETHYFDHPKFGMIVLVTPYEYRGGRDESEEELGAAPPSSSDIP